MATRDNHLDQFEAKCGLPTLKDISLSNEIEGYLSLTREEADKLSPEDCAEIGLRLEQTAHYIQRCYNKEQAHVTWAKSKLNLYISSKTGNYKGSFIQQENQAIAEDSYAKELHDIVTYAQQRCDRLSYISASLTRLADRLYHLQMAKSRRVNS